MKVVKLVELPVNTTDTCWLVVTVPTAPVLVLEVRVAAAVEAPEGESELVLKVLDAPVRVMPTS